MGQEKKAGILERMFIACFRPSRYKEILACRTSQHVTYVIAVVFLLMVIELAVPFAAWDVSIGGLATLFSERIPAFSVEDGTMTIARPLDFDLNGIIHFKADSSVEQYKKDDFNEKYPEEFLFSASNLMVKMGDRVMDISMKEAGESRLTNQTLVEAVPFFRILLGIYFLSSYVMKGAEYMVAALFFAVLCRAAIRRPDGVFVNFKGMLVIAVYAKTLFTLIRSVNTCMGNPFGETLVLILCTFGTILYVDRAQAAVLDVQFRKK